MRGRLLVALLATAMFTALPATAQAGYAYMAIDDGTGWATFAALPTERPDLRIQTLDGGTTVMVEDRASPFTPGMPPTATGSGTVPCEIVSAHLARCQSPTLFSFQTDLSLNSGAKIRDVPGSGLLIYFVSTGPGDDTIDLSYGSTTHVWDLGGVNTIRLGSDIGSNSNVSIGPGSSTVDVANGNLDSVRCLSVDQVGLFDQPELGIGEHNVLDTVMADPNDRVIDCD